MQEESTPGKEESPPNKRGRPRKQVDKEPTEEAPAKPKQEQQTPAKPKQVLLQQTSTHITRSMTKTMVKEEKEALFDKDQLEKELKESRKSKVKEFDFGGPVGVFFMMLALPALVYATYFYCNGKDSKCSFRNNPIKLPHWRTFFDEAHLVYDGWLLFQVILFLVPYGKVR